MTPEDVDRLTERIETWLLNWMVEHAAVPKEECDPNKPFAEYGLDSMTAVEMSHELEFWVGVRIDATVAWNYPTPSTLARHLSKQLAGIDEEESVAEHDAGSDGALLELLSDIESMSDEATEELLKELHDN